MDQRQRRIKEVRGRWNISLTMELREKTDKEWNRKRTSEIF
jgi:hypothetical protein